MCILSLKAQVLSIFANGDNEYYYFLSPAWSDRNRSRLTRVAAPELGSVRKDSGESDNAALLSVCDLPNSLCSKPLMEG